MSEQEPEGRRANRFNVFTGQSGAWGVLPGDGSGAYVRPSESGAMPKRRGLGPVSLVISILIVAALACGGFWLYRHHRASVPATHHSSGH